MKMSPGARAGANEQGRRSVRRSTRLHSLRVLLESPRAESRASAPPLRKSAQAGGEAPKYCRAHAGMPNLPQSGQLLTYCVSLERSQERKRSVEGVNATRLDLSPYSKSDSKQAQTESPLHAGTRQGGRQSGTGTRKVRCLCHSVLDGDRRAKYSEPLS